MRRLPSADESIGSAAREELRRQGLTPLQIELAGRLFHPDPEIRAQLARMLPGMPGVNAAGWLVQLARDTDPEVRYTAITLLATTADPALLQQIELLARQDSDPRIQRQADRLAQRDAKQRETKRK